MLFTRQNSLFASISGVIQLSLFFFFFIANILKKSRMTYGKKPFCVLILHSSQPFTMVPFDLYHIVCSVFFFTFSLPLDHAFVEDAVWITRLSLGYSHPISSHSSSLLSAGEAILMDTHGNGSHGRQQTVAVQGQHKKTINHNSRFRPAECSRSHSTKKQFCQHVFAHLSSSASGLFWAPVTDIFFPVEAKQILLLDQTIYTLASKVCWHPKKTTKKQLPWNK